MDDMTRQAAKTSCMWSLYDHFILLKINNLDQIQLNCFAKHFFEVILFIVSCIIKDVRKRQNYIFCKQDRRQSHVRYG
jgi:hypothetical protein